MKEKMRSCQWVRLIHIYSKYNNNINIEKHLLLWKGLVWCCIWCVCVCAISKVQIKSSSGTVVLSASSRLVSLALPISLFPCCSVFTFPCAARCSSNVINSLFTLLYMLHKARTRLRGRPPLSFFRELPPVYKLVKKSISKNQLENQK